ncbi:hypothetical protein BGZ75_008655 [Mortierella antarctica]|nr:hypothetical protein BGZ75_008655 [Mortierella antarctica]
MPEGSTIDAALMHHEMKQSFLVRRYTLAQSGSCYLNLPPEVTPGTYSLLLTVYKERTAVVLGRSLVPVIHIIDKGVLNTPRRVQAPSLAMPAGTSSQDRKETRDERTLLKSAAMKSKFGGADGSLSTAALDQEKIHLINETGGKIRVRRAPYTLGWKVPDALRDVPNARADILLVKSGNHLEDSDRTTKRALATNLSAHAGFYVVLLPMDLISEEEYRLQIVISGAGRTFVGSSRAFTTTPPAFAEKTS